MTETVQTQDTWTLAGRTLNSRLIVGTGGRLVCLGSCAFDVGESASTRERVGVGALVTGHVTRGVT